MTEEQLRRARAPFEVVERRTGDRAVVAGFVLVRDGGRRVPAARFSTGGWVGLADLLRFYDVLPLNQWARNAPKIRIEA